MSNLGSGVWTASSSSNVNINNANISNGSNTISIGNPPYSTGGTTTGICTCGNNCGGSLCGNSIYYPNAGTYQPYIYQPPTQTIQFGTTNQKYSVMDLPRTEMPRAVFVCGRMVTLGILGTDVECAFVGEYLVFAPGVINYVWNTRTTVIIEYADAFYHYNVGQNGTDMFEKESAKLNTTLVSTIKK